MVKIPKKETNLKLENIPLVKKKGSKFFLTKNKDSKSIDLEKLKRQVDTLENWRENLKLYDTWQDIKKKIIKINTKIFSSSGSDIDKIFIDGKDSATLSYDSFDNEIELFLYSDSFYRETILDYELKHNLELTDVEYWEIGSISDINKSKELKIEDKKEIIRLIKEKYLNFADWLKSLKEVWKLIFEHLPILQIKLSEKGLGDILIAEIEESNPRKPIIIKQRNKLALLKKKSLLLDELKQQRFMGNLIGAVNELTKSPKK